MIDLVERERKEHQILGLFFLFLIFGLLFVKVLGWLLFVGMFGLVVVLLYVNGVEYNAKNAKDKFIVEEDN